MGSVATSRPFMRLGPPSWWYLVGAGLWTVGLLLAYIVGYTVHTDRMDAAAGYARGDARAAELKVETAGTYVIWMETKVGDPLPRVLRNPLPRLGEVRLTNASGRTVRVRPSTASDYRITMDGATRTGRAVGEARLAPGTYRARVGERGATAIAMGQEPEGKTRVGMVALGGVLALAGVAAWIVTGVLRRAGANRLARSIQAARTGR
ncbi:hypothetical protein [Actinomadura sp. 7K507]|uniref:hypothetical protein n=1 Tax=Actinomadura sp. 7K507 TaxID=2530365 RepID=UPI0010511AB2|nr:hypothetical protein [Actinomadura sp. 7K507]TDC76010.1 hypothetical protein E1285_40545 [Actinomadura sp. 7K507]